MKDIYEKLKKLVVHEQSARVIGNIAEADAFAQKISKILLKYNISHEQLAASCVQTDIGVEVLAYASLEEWHPQLARVIAASRDCEVRINKTGALAIVGTRRNRERAAEKFRVLTKRMSSMAKVFGEKYIGDHRDRVPIDIAHTSFLFGIVEMLEQKMIVDRWRKTDGAGSSPKAATITRSHSNEAFIAALGAFDAKDKDTEICLDPGCFTAGLVAGKDINIEADELDA